MMDHHKQDDNQKKGKLVEPVTELVKLYRHAHKSLLHYLGGFSADFSVNMTSFPQALCLTLHEAPFTEVPVKPSVFRDGALLP